MSLLNGTSAAARHSAIRSFGRSAVRKGRRAFTLIEVNLAMLIMAGGILSIVGLYAFGFRENRQSREDVAASAYADAVVSPLVMAISATNLKWSVFREKFNYPGDKGWGEYFNNEGLVTQDPQGNAETAFKGVIGKMESAAVGTFDSPDFPSTAKPTKPKMSCGLVVMHAKDSAVVSIGFRAVETDRPGTLLSMPLFYTEVRFQGLANE